MYSFTSAANETAAADTPITKKDSCKMHIASFKLVVYKEFFDHDEKIILANWQSPFQIYWVCKLFEEVKPSKEFKQLDMLKNYQAGIYIGVNYFKLILLF